jgi:hypothetical protein
MGAVVVHADDVESPNGVFRGLSGPLGVSGFRVNRLELPAGAEGPGRSTTTRATVRKRCTQSSRAVVYFA